jgi:class 3 adenylate cyclase
MAACRRALDAAAEASAHLKIRNLEREAADLPFADADIALHVGEVLYGNVGAVDPRLMRWFEWNSSVNLWVNSGSTDPVLISVC